MEQHSPPVPINEVSPVSSFDRDPDEFFVTRNGVDDLDKYEGQLGQIVGIASFFRVFRIIVMFSLLSLLLAFVSSDAIL